MSVVWRVIGAIIAIIGGLIIFSTLYDFSGDTPELSTDLPTTDELEYKLYTMIVGGIVMFIGFGIISLGWWLCRRSS